MAKLYGRILRFPHHTLDVLAATLWAACALAAPAMAQPGHLGTTLTELEALAALLASPEEGERQVAYGRLSTLDEGALEAIDARLGRLRRQWLPSEESFRALRSFRFALGSRRADDTIDMAPGILPVLAEDRSRLQVALAERLLLLRSLEAMGTVEAGARMVQLMGQDSATWRWEGMRIVRRMGVRILPILIRARSYDDRGIRRWARWGVRELAMTDPGRAVRQSDAHLTAEVLRAYGAVRDMEAMTVVVSLTTHEQATIRDAAREATAAYGRHAIWQTRLAFKNATGRDANQAWGWRRALRELCKADDGERFAPAVESVERGQEALSRGDLIAMATHFDAALRAAPDLPGRADLAEGYAQLAAERLEDEQFRAALRRYRRAARLAPEADGAERWAARIAFIEAELNRQRGIADTPGYERAMIHDPDETATAAAASLGDEPASTRRWIGALVALILLMAFLAVWARKPRSAELVDEAEALPTDTAPDTLPG